MQKILFIILIVLPFSSCKKCGFKGDSLLIANFDNQGEWWLISDVSDSTEIYSKVENGVLKLKTEQGSFNCQRATYYWTQDLSAIEGFEICVRINELMLPKDLKLHVYASLGNYEMYATIDKRDTENKVLFIRVDNNGIHSNLKGTLNDNLGYKVDSDNYSTNFFQISLCPDSTIESEGEMYLEIDKIEITTL